MFYSKKSPPHPEVTNIHKQQQENSLAGIRLPRDISTDIPVKSPVGMGSEDTLKSSIKDKLDCELQTTNVGTQHQKCPKSPMSFLPAALRQPFSKQTFSVLNANMNSGLKIHLPNMPKVNLQDLNPVNLVKNGPAGKAAERFSRVFHVADYSSSESEEGGGGLEEEDLVLGSCGILATSPSSLLLKAAAAKTSEQGRSATWERTKTAIVIKTENDHSQLESDIPPREHEQNLFSVDSEEDLNLTLGTVQRRTSDSISQKLVQFDRAQSPQTSVPGSEDESASCSENNNYSELLPRLEPSSSKRSSPRSSRLFHSNMKMSLSDTSITLSKTSLGKTSDERPSGKAIAGNTSPFSRLKLRMANLSLPSTGPKGQVVIHKGMVRKSQRLLEIFEKMAREKLGDEECRSRIIFI